MKYVETKRIQGQTVIAMTQEVQHTADKLDLEAMMAHTPDAIIALNRNFQICELNPAASAALGWTREEACGCSCTEVLHCQSIDHVELCGTPGCPLVRVVQREQSLPQEELIIGIRPEHQLEVSASVTHFRSPRSYSSESPSQYNHADHTDSSHHANGMLDTKLSNKVNAREDDCIVFTARDFSALKVANTVRSNFVSMVSHELRTPLNSVNGFIELLIQGHMGPLSDQQKTYLGYTQQGVSQLISIVEDILFMSRSDLGQFQLQQQQVSLRTLVRQVFIGLQPQARKAEVVLRQEIASGLPSLYIDPKRIIQVLNNLLVNAIKFTPPAGIITVKACRLNADFVTISVTDTGAGIPQEDQTHVFERFYQSNHPTKMGGCGLGLSITKLIVEQHGGTIDLESVVDQGTTFCFTMPVFKKRMIRAS